MDISNLNYDYENEWDDEPLTPEEQAKADRAYYQQQEQEAYAEFLQSPYCFDWSNFLRRPAQAKSFTNTPNFFPDLRSLIIFSQIKCRWWGV